MIINKENLDLAFQGFQTAFNKFYETTETEFSKISMVVPSMAEEEVYGWMGQFPRMRQWIGDRVVNNLSLHDFKIKNKDFENTISVPRNAFEDEKYGIFAPMFNELGRDAAELPDRLIFDLLKNGFTQTGFDGQNFFDTDHPVLDENGNPQSVANTDGGEGTPWFLLDTSRAVKPLVYQRRRAFSLIRLDRPEDPNVFFKKEYVYGVDGRSNAGYGLWQLAWGSKETLDATNYEAARQAMMELKGDYGRPLGVKPDTLVVPPALEGAAMRLLNRGDRIEDSGGTPVAVANEWSGTARVIVTPWLA